MPHLPGKANTSANVFIVLLNVLLVANGIDKHTGFAAK